MDGAIAQLVEQRTENPCVPGSIPGGTTAKNAKLFTKGFSVFLLGIVRTMQKGCTFSMDLYNENGKKYTNI